MNVFAAVGKTPLLELNRICPSHVKIFGKAEFLNPGGSVKDRAAKAMLTEGIASGKLKPNMEILDATSGSTGVSYCIMAKEIGCSVTLCIPACASRIRKATIRALGGTVVETDPLQGSEGAYNKAQELLKEFPERYFYPDQYNNKRNWQAHYETTAEEIWEQTEGKITHFVAGAGTGGTFVGAVRRLKELNPHLTAILAQPDSPFHGLSGLRHLRTAARRGFFDENLVDNEATVSTENAYNMTRCLAKEEGLLVGISSGANVWASVETAKNAKDGSVIVTVLCDNGINYLDEPVWNYEKI